jgi:hypothetical protein
VRKVYQSLSFHGGPTLVSAPAPDNLPRLQVRYDVYKPSPQFRKGHLAPPDFGVLILSNATLSFPPMPTLRQLLQQPASFEAPLKLALVDTGIVNFYGISNVSLPSIETTCIVRDAKRDASRDPVA